MVKQTTAKQRFAVRTLHNASHLHTKIAEQLNISPYQARYAVNKGEIPKTGSGRPKKLTPSQIEELVEFITSSVEGRRTPFSEIAEALGWNNIGTYCIRYTLVLKTILSCKSWKPFGFY